LDFDVNVDAEAILPGSSNSYSIVNQKVNNNKKKNNFSENGNNGNSNNVNKAIGNVNVAGNVNTKQKEMLKYDTLKSLH
jgi:hypothetical protein